MKDQNPNRNSASSELPVEVEAWLDEQPVEDAQALKEVWTLAAHAQLFDPPCELDEKRFDQMCTAVHAATKTVKRASKSDRASMRLLNMRLLKVAASLIILVFAGSFWWTRPIVHVAPWGDQLSVHLPDGSDVALNSGSQLLHRRSFGSENRRVTLRGEAFFDVAHSHTPFLVETFNGTVTVLGTRFNVRAWESDDVPETVVVLEQGSVLLRGLTVDVDPVILKPGEISRISGVDAPSAPILVDINQNMSWRSGGLMFVDQRVGVVADEIQRRFNVQVKIIPESLRQERVTFRLSEVRNAEEVLSIVAVARGYTLEETNGLFKLVKP